MEYLLLRRNALNVARSSKPMPTILFSTGTAEGGTNIDEIVSNLVDEIVDSIKQQWSERGFPMSEMNEIFFRAGMLQGLSLSSVLLTKISAEAILDIRDENELS